MIRLREIDAKAKAATSGRWSRGPHYAHTIVAEHRGEIGEMKWTPQGNADADYIASVDPDVGQALVEVARKARAFLDHAGDQFPAGNFDKAAQARTALLDALAEFTE